MTLHMTALADLLDTADLPDRLCPRRGSFR